MRLCFAAVYQLVSQNIVKRDIQQTVGVQMADFVVVIQYSVPPNR